MTVRRRLALGLMVAGAFMLACELMFRAYLLIDPGVEDSVAQRRAEYAPDLGADFKIEPHPYFIYTHSTLQSDVNRWGFTFDELPLAKAEGTIRILCMGGSTTAGARSWPYLLENELTAKGWNVEVLNFGVPGWTSTESLSALVLLGLEFAPDHVLVHHANNDLAPLMTPGFRPDYAHYRQPIAMERKEMGRLQIRSDLSWSVDTTLMNLSSIYTYASLWLRRDPPTRFTLEQLAVRDVKVGNDPEPNIGTFDRNLRRMALLSQSVGAEFWAVTMPRNSVEMISTALLDGMNERVAQLANEEGWNLIDLRTGDWDDAWFTDQVHLTPQGLQIKARRISEQLGLNQ